jgi:hypothetical protein
MAVARSTPGRPRSGTDDENESAVENSPSLVSLSGSTCPWMTFEVGLPDTGPLARPSDPAGHAEETQRQEKIKSQRSAARPTLAAGDRGAGTPVRSPPRPTPTPTRRCSIPSLPDEKDPVLGVRRVEIDWTASGVIGHRGIDARPRIVELDIKCPRCAPQIQGRGGRSLGIDDVGLPEIGQAIDPLPGRPIAGRARPQRKKEQDGEDARKDNGH